MSLQRVAFSPLHTFTRATNETFFNQVVDSFGNVSYELQTAPSGTAVQNAYDPSTGEPLGLQLFEQRTNLLLRSQELNLSPWSSQLATVTPDYETAPDGTLTADRLVFAGGAFPQIFQSFTLTAGLSYTFSCWVKSDGTSQIQQTLLLDGSTTAFTPTSTWQRVSVTVASSAGGSKAASIVTNSNSAPASSFLAWGAQLEAGAFVTPYIKTEATTATRNASVAVINDIDESEWWNASEGTFVVEWNEGNNLKSTGILVAGTGGITPSDAYFGLQKRISANYELTYMSTSSVGTVVSTGVPVTAGNHTATLRYIGNTVSLSVDGSAEISRTNVKRGQTILFIGLLLAGGTPLNGHIKSIIYYPSAGV